jgi:hypothetical protein
VFVDGTPKIKLWKEGKVVKVDYFGMAYECSFLGPRNRLTTCFLIGDDDEHVCKVDASPRERLLDAIDQCCNYYHIDYLVTPTELAVTSFQDLLVARAIQSCSYDAIWWLQNNTTINLVRVVDTNGNGLLHQTSMKSQAAIFFRRASQIEWRNGNYGNEKLDFHRGEPSLIQHTNHQSRSWLHGLVIAGNARALSQIFYSGGGMAWRVAEMIRYDFEHTVEMAQWTFHSRTRDLKGTNLRDTARLLGWIEIEMMINEFAIFYLLFDLEGNF